MFRENWVLPDIAVLIIIAFAANSAIGHNDGWNVSRFCLAHQLNDIIVNLSNRKVVFDGRIAVHDK